MSKLSSKIVVILHCSWFLFALFVSFFWKYLLTDFTPTLKTEFIFDLKLKDIYDKVHYDFEL